MNERHPAILSPLILSCLQPAARCRRGQKKKSKRGQDCDDEYEVEEPRKTIIVIHEWPSSRTGHSMLRTGDECQ